MVWGSGLDWVAKTVDAHGVSPKHISEYSELKMGVLEGIMDFDS